MSHWQGRTKIRRADKLFSEYIRKRDGDCVYKIRCMGGWYFKELTNSHYYGRAKESVRFDPENCDTACRKCHDWVEHTAEGKQWLDMWKVEQLGAVRFERLAIRANQFSKRDDKLTVLYVKELLKTLPKEEAVFESPI